MKVKAIQISEALQGILEGNPDVEVFKPAKIEEGTAGSITFLSNMKYKNYLYTTEASVVLIPTDFVLEKEVSATLIRVASPYEAFSQLLGLYQSMLPAPKIGIEQPSFIAASAEIGEAVYVGAFTRIGENVKIGKNVKIYSNVSIADHTTIADNTIIHNGVHIYSASVIGKNCEIHSGTIIGSDGFGFAPQQDGSYKKIPQIGNVVIEDDVEIGANVTIDRATLGSTIIRQGVKIDNLVQIAHNVEVGKNTVIASQTGIAGSAKIGNNCTIGGQVGIVGHIIIGNNVKIQAQSGVGHNLPDKTAVQGTPALSYMEYNRAYVLFKKLPELEKRITELEDKECNK